MRESLPGEIIPVGATQSSTRNNDEANNGAGRAIDGDYTTKHHAVGKNGGNPWLKISLDQVYCVERVVKYNKEDSIWQSWTCTETGCSCTAGNFCSDFTMLISTEGQTVDKPSISECSFGDTVKYEKKDPTQELSSHEIAVFGKAAAVIPYPGKF